MSETTKLNMMVQGVKINRTVKVKADQESDEAKTIHLVITIDNVPLNDIINDAVKSDVIRWQASARKSFNSLEDGGTIHRIYRAPAPAQDPEAAMVARLISMTDDEKTAYLAELVKKANKK